MLALHINPYQDSYPSKQKVVCVHICIYMATKRVVSFSENWDTKVMNVIIYKIRKKSQNHELKRQFLTLEEKH